MVHFYREDSQFNQSAIGEVASFSLSYSNLPFERIRSFTSSLIAGKQLDMTHLSAFSRAERFEKVSTNLFQFFHIFSFLKLKLHASTTIHEHCLTHSTCFVLQSVGPCGSSAGIIDFARCAQCTALVLRVTLLGILASLPGLFKRCQQILEDFLPADLGNSEEIGSLKNAFRKISHGPWPFGNPSYTLFEVNLASNRIKSHQTKSKTTG